MTAPLTVDAVHHAEEELAGFGVAPLDEGFDLVLEGALTRRVGLHQVAAPFIDDQKVVVLVQNIFGSEHRKRSVTAKQIITET